MATALITANIFIAGPLANPAIGAPLGVHPYDALGLRAGCTIHALPDGALDVPPPVPPANPGWAAFGFEVARAAVVALLGFVPGFFDRDGASARPIGDCETAVAAMDECGRETSATVVGAANKRPAHVTPVGL